MNCAELFPIVPDPALPTSLVCCIGILSMIAMFPDFALSVEDIYWMGNQQDGFLVSVRWGAIGTHKGNGIYGPPTNKDCSIWGITQWEIKKNIIVKEWTVFNEFSIFVQLLRDK